MQQSPEVLTEAIQTILRKHGQADAYEQLKAFSRGKALSFEQVQEFIKQAKIPNEEKKG